LQKKGRVLSVHDFRNAITTIGYKKRNKYDGKFVPTVRIY